MERADDLHSTDAFARACKISIDNYTPDYVVTPEELAQARALLPAGKRLLGVQMRASVANRDYPIQNWIQVIDKLIKRGWHPVFLGHKGSLPPFKKNGEFTDLSEYGLPFRVSAAALSLCQAFVGVDSVFLHLCHPLKVPAVGLYGPFPWQNRTKYSPLTTAISGVGDCAPCHWHPTAGRQFPPDKPCARLKKCTVLESIPVDRIVSKVDALREEQPSSASA